jgi:hypothetical protein
MGVDIFSGCGNLQLMECESSKRSGKIRARQMRFFCARVMVNGREGGE